MANVMAIVSKAVFDKMVGKAKPKLGDVLVTNQYVSNNPRLDAVKGGGALFLVTVRPPDEALWLVAILENPKHNGSAWVSAANAIAMTDIGALKDKLKFDSGNGIQAKPGALGMSLQTPRVLTDGDVALLRKAAGGAAPAASSEPASKPNNSSDAKKSSASIDPWRWRAPRSSDEALALAFWSQLSATERRRYVRAIEAQTQGAVRFVRSHGFGGRTVELFVHGATGIAMHLIPGGSLSLGVSERDRERLQKIEGASALRAFAESDALRSSPPVRVAPFLLAARPLDGASVLSLLTGDRADPSRIHAIRRANAAAYAALLLGEGNGRVAASRLPVIEAALESAGLRLPSESEWEWAARAGRESLTVSGDDKPTAPRAAPNGFGLAALGEDPELCADGWAGSHEGIAANGAPRAKNGRGTRVVRGGASAAWKQPDGWKWLLSAARRSSSEAGESFALRPALSVRL